MGILKKKIHSIHATSIELGKTIKFKWSIATGKTSQAILPFHFFGFHH